MKWGHDSEPGQEGIAVYHLRSPHGVWDQGGAERVQMSCYLKVRENLFLWDMLCDTKFSRTPEPTKLRCWLVQKQFCGVCTAMHAVITAYNTSSLCSKNKNRLQIMSCQSSLHSILIII